MIQGRYRVHEDSSQMSNILGPLVQRVLPRDYHKENLMIMKKKEEEL
jgi:hypothetical protein